MSKAIVVTEVSDVKQDSNDQARDFKTIKVRKVQNAMVFNPLTKRMEMALGNEVDGTINLWEKSYLNDKMEVGYNATVNTPLLGDIVTRKVTPYPIPDGNGGNRTVDTYTCVVIGDTDEKESFERSVARAFKSAGHPILSEDSISEEVLENEAFEEKVVTAPAKVVTAPAKPAAKKKGN